MDEEGSDDELPSISFQSSQNTSGRLVCMPSATEVAAQRARESRTERELRRMDEEGAGGGGGVAGVRSDSSGSEGETVLARCAAALARLCPAPPRPAPHTRVALALLRSLPHADFLTDYITALEDYEHLARFNKLTDQIVRGLASALAHEDNEWSEDERVLSAGVLCAASLAGGGGRVRRALQRVAGGAGGGVTSRLAGLAARAAGRGGARALLALSDALHDPAGPHDVNNLAAILVYHAMMLLLEPNTDIEDCSEPDIYRIAAALESGAVNATREGPLTGVRGAARALRGAAGGERGRLLGALRTAAATTPRHHPDYLKVMVSCKTLQLLFRAASPPPANT